MGNVVVLSGGFDPVHEGHIALFEEAKHKYDYVVVGLNSDQWLARKKGKPFMSFDSRRKVLESISYIDEVWPFTDIDDTANALLVRVNNVFPDRAIVFGNGGDRSGGRFPEFLYCKKNNIVIDDTLGGTNKMNSSSNLLADWLVEQETRDWGEWKVLHNYSNGTKVKELVVLPGKSLSWQKHEHRSELWFIREGTATLHYAVGEDAPQKMTLEKHDSAFIALEEWHKLSNETDKLVSVVEIQYGDLCEESDIIRLPFPTTKETT